MSVYAQHERMDWNQLRRAILPKLHPYTKAFRPLIRDKTNNDTEHIQTTEKSISHIRSVLRSAGFFSLPLATLKYLEKDGSRHYEVLSMGRLEDNGRQTHIYVFDIDGRRLIYCHYEDAFYRIQAHQDASNMVRGDPENRVSEF